MKRSNRSWWRKVAVAAVTLPLLATSCVEIFQRTLINGFFDAATPLIDERLKDHLTEDFATDEEP